MRGPPKERGPAVATPGHDLNAVSTQDRNETYAETAGLSTAATAEILAFPRKPVRWLLIVPHLDAGDRDYCDTVPCGRPVDDLGGFIAARLELARALARPRGLPVHVHPECIRRAAR